MSDGSGPVIGACGKQNERESRVFTYCQGHGQMLRYRYINTFNAGTEIQVEHVLIHQRFGVAAGDINCHLFGFLGAPER